MALAVCLSFDLSGLEEVKVLVKIFVSNLIHAPCKGFSSHLISGLREDAVLGQPHHQPAHWLNFKLILLLSIFVLAQHLADPHC